MKSGKKWLLLTLIAGCLAVVQSGLILYRIGFAELIGKTVGKTASVDPSAAIGNALEHKSVIVTTQFISGCLGPTIFVACIAGLLWLLMLSLGGNVRYTVVAETVAKCNLVIAVTRFAILLPVLLIIPSNEYNPLNPLGTNLTFYFPLQSASWGTLLLHLDVLSLAMVVGVAYLLTKKVSGLSPALTGAVVGGGWIGYLGLMALLA